jgi:hypothetical protein
MNTAREPDVVCVHCGEPAGEWCGWLHLPQQIAHIVGITDGIPRQLLYPLCAGCMWTTNQDVTEENRDEVEEFCRECDERALRIVVEATRIPRGMSVAFDDVLHMHGNDGART